MLGEIDLDLAAGTNFPLELFDKIAIKAALQSVYRLMTTSKKVRKAMRSTPELSPEHFLAAFKVWLRKVWLIKQQEQEEQHYQLEEEEVIFLFHPLDVTTTTFPLAYLKLVNSIEGVIDEIAIYDRIACFRPVWRMIGGVSLLALAVAHVCGKGPYSHSFATFNLSLAALAGCSVAVAYFLYLNPSHYELCKAARYALSSQSVPVFRVLLSDARCNILWNDEDFLSLAGSHGTKEIMQELLISPNFNARTNGLYLLEQTAKAGNSVALKELLLDSRIDPGKNLNNALYLASTYNQKECVQILLNDDRVDAGMFNNLILRKVIKQALMAGGGHQMLPVIELLVNHPTIDPSIEDNRDYKEALANGQIEIVRIFLRHIKVRESLLLD